MNGEASPPGSEDAVLILVADVERGTVCSAALVAPNLAVTARHCVAAIVDGNFVCSDAGELKNDGSGAGLFAEEYAPEKLLFYGGPPRRTQPLAKGRRVISTLPSDVCVNDLAFVVLDRELELPSLPLRLSAPLEAGERISVVGYGPPAQESLVLQTAPRTRKSGIVVERVGPDSALDGVPSPAPRSFTTYGAYACYGDSGAPAIAEADGRVVGVYSTQQGDSCTADSVVNHFVHLPPYRALVESAFVAAGLPPGGPEPAAAGGAPSAGAGGAAGERSVEPPRADAGSAGEVTPVVSAGAEAGTGGGADEAPIVPPDRVPSGGCAVVRWMTDASAVPPLATLALLASLARRRKRR